MNEYTMIASSRKIAHVAMTQYNTIKNPNKEECFEDLPSEEDMVVVP